MGSAPAQNEHHVNFGGKTEIAPPIIESKTEVTPLKMYGDPDRYNNPVSQPLADDELGSGARTPRSQVGAPSVVPSSTKTGLSMKPRVKTQWTDKFVKIMVVGERGLGKSTFIHNLVTFYSHVEGGSVPPKHTPHAHIDPHIFANSPEQYCEEVIIKDDDLAVMNHFLIQDTPGHPDFSEGFHPTIEPIVSYLRKQDDVYMALERDAARTTAVSRFPDNRVDAVLYFISPHNLKPGDIKYINILRKHAPVLPILAKADCFTPQELAEFRTHVRLQLFSKSPGKPDHYDSDLAIFTQGLLSEAGATAAEHPPFSVIGSSQYLDTAPAEDWSPIRRYTWGEVKATQVSDILPLMRLLFEVGPPEMKDQTEKRYHAYRASLLLAAEEEAAKKKKGVSCFGR